MGLAVPIHWSMKQLGEVFDSLLGAARADNEWAWDRLVRWFGPKVLAYARSQGMSDPEDVLGDVLVDVVRGLSGFQGAESQFRSWVFMIAHSRIVDRRRAEARRPSVAWDPTLDPAAPESQSAWADLGDMQSQVDALPPNQRDVLLLRTVVGLSIEDTAEVLGKKQGAVRVAHHRALETLRQQMALGV